MAPNDDNGQWKFAQCFGDKNETLDVAEADIISTVKFDQTGDFLASGDRAGRVVVFQRNHSKKNCEYRFYTEFQSHEPEFDYLKSLEINEKINKIQWCRRGSSGVGSSADSLLLLTTNDKTIKLWKVKERRTQLVIENNTSMAHKLASTDVRLPLMLPKLQQRDASIGASAKKTYGNAHAYHIHSISLNSDGETFLSADDLRVNLWNLGDVEQSFNVIDMKPDSIEELTEVITTASFHPQHCHLFALGTSKGVVRLADLRAAALCDGHARTFARPGLLDSASSGAAAGSHSFFSELISSINDLAFSPDGRRFATRDYLTVKIWDLAQESRPLHIIPVHDVIKAKLCDLYENDSIFDKFETTWSHDSSLVATGSYSNYVRVSLADPSTATVHMEGGAHVYPLHDAIHADKSIFRSRKSSASRGRLGSANGLGNGIGPDLTATCKLDELKASEMDFERKILHESFHPTENTIAVAALCNLFIFTQPARSTAPSQSAQQLTTLSASDVS